MGAFERAAGNEAFPGSFREIISSTALCGRSHAAYLIPLTIIDAPLQNAITASLNYDKCLALQGDAKLGCQLDKAMANVGAILAGQVEGRICTEVDPRLAKDSSASAFHGTCTSLCLQCRGSWEGQILSEVPPWLHSTAHAALCDLQDN